MTPLSIEGAWLITPKIHHDPRGEFFELYQSRDFAKAVGAEFDLRQASISVSRKGVVRGIHYSRPGQDKYVTCVRGSVMDVIVDIRPDSATFGQHEMVELNDINRRALFIPGALGHGFCALTDGATMVYLQSTIYDSEAERGLDPLDPALAIPWPAIYPELSRRDQDAPTLSQAMERGLL